MTEELKQELVSTLQAALEWIDAVPATTPLPAMPGLCRDDVDALIERALTAAQPAQAAQVPEVARRHTNAQALDCADRLNRSFPPTPLKDEAADHIRELVALTLTAAQQGDEHG